MWSAWNYQMLGRGNKVRLINFLSNAYVRYRLWFSKGDTSYNAASMAMAFNIGLCLAGVIIIIIVIATAF